MAMIKCVHLVILSSLVMMQKHGHDVSVCQPNISTTGVKKPVLPNTFTAQIEVNILNKKTTLEVSEYHDSIKNLAAVHQWRNGTETLIIASFPTNELITFRPYSTNNPSLPHCETTSLRNDSSVDKIMFGMKIFSNGTDHVFSAAGALSFGRNLTEKYIGKANIRGILADQWRACAYWPDMDATMTIDWYFSAKDWLTSTGDSQIPLQCHVTGVKWDSRNQSHKFEHIYDVIEFRSQVNPKHFEVPSGIFCKNRKNTKPPPNAPGHFSFGAEVMILESHKVHYLKEVFDYKNKMVRLDYKPNLFGDQSTGIHRMSEVHDFNTGVAYVTDLHTGNCTFRLIPTSGFDAEPLSNNIDLVRIRSGFEFFFTDTAINITYAGKRTVRGIECDVWNAIKYDWPVIEPSISVWEWYFARPGWQQQAGMSFEFGMPVRIAVTTYGSDHTHYIYNIYDYNEDIPNFWTFDISKCYNYNNKRFVRFLLPGNYTQLVLPNESIFKYLVLISVTGYTDISPIRVTNMELDHNSKYILVSFYILGPAPIRGDIAKYNKETPLNKAVNILTNAINNRKFVVEVDKSSLSTMTSITAVPYSDSLWGYKSATLAPADEENLDIEDIQTPDKEKLDIEDTQTPDKEKLDTEDTQTPDKEKLDTEDIQIPDKEKLDIDDIQIPDKEKLDIEDIQIPDKEKLDIEDIQIPDKEKLDTEDIQIPDKEKLDIEDTQIPDKEKLDTEDIQIPHKEKLDIEDTQIPDKEKLDTEDTETPDKEKLDTEDTQTPDKEKLDTEDIQIPDREKLDTEDTETPDKEKLDTEDTQTPDKEKLDTEDTQTPDREKLDIDDTQTPDKEKLDTEDIQTPDKEKLNIEDIQTPDKENNKKESRNESPVIQSKQMNIENMSIPQEFIESKKKTADFNEEDSNESTDERGNEHLHDIQTKHDYFYEDTKQTDSLSEGDDYDRNSESQSRKSLKQKPLDNNKHLLRWKREINSRTQQEHVNLAVKLCVQQTMGFSSGAMAGVAVGMLALGFFVVFLALTFGPRLTRNIFIHNEGYEMT